MRSRPKPRAASSMGPRVALAHPGGSRTHKWTRGPGIRTIVDKKSNFGYFLCETQVEPRYSCSFSLFFGDLGFFVYKPRVEFLSTKTPPERAAGRATGPARTARPLPAKLCGVCTRGARVDPHGARISRVDKKSAGLKTKSTRNSTLFRLFVYNGR